MVGTLHIRHDQFGFTSLARVVLFPLLLGQVLQERIEPFVHPRPLTLVAVDDHREIVVAYFMDDHGDQIVFGGRRIRPILPRSWAVETNHRVFHATDGSIDTDGNWVRVIKRVSAVDIERVNDRVGRVLAPQRLAFVGVITHGHDRVVIDFVALGIPDEFSAGGKGKVADGFGSIDPCFGLVGLFLFILFGFFGRDDEDGSIGMTCLLEPF